MDFIKFFCSPLLFSILSAAFLGGCMGSRLPRELARPSALRAVESPAVASAPSTPDGAQPGTSATASPHLEGTVVSSEGPLVDLSQINASPPVLLVFSNEFCEVCRSEAPRLKSLEPAIAANELQVITILAGGNPQVAQSWKKDFQIAWLTVADETTELFGRYCPEFKTPCTLLFDAAKGGIVFRHYGAIDPATLLEKIRSPKEELHATK